MTKLISINSIASQLKMDPKLARKKLRSLGSKAPKSVSKTRWEFEAKAATAVKKLLAA